MKNVLLINTNTEKNPYPVPPIGLCMIAKSIEKSYNVKIYDAMFDEGESISNIIKEFKPNYIGCSIRNIDPMSVDSNDFFLEKIKEIIIKQIKKSTNAKIILGGSGFSIFPKETLEFLNADYGIIGEGEESFSKLLTNLDNDESTENIEGVISKYSSDFFKTSPLLNYSEKNYFSEVYKYIDFTPYKERGAYSIQTKRGCAHKCIYCTYPIIEGNRFRSRSPMSIVDEIEEAYNVLGNVVFEFVDSTFNDPKGHAEEICKEIIKRKIKGRFRTMGINPANVSDELLELMIKAGFTQIDFTPDTASPIMLKNLGKNFTIKQLQKSAGLVKKHDIPTMWFFVFGGPGEHFSTIDETFEFINNFVSPDDLVYLASSLRIYPKTKLYEIAIKEGLLDENDSLFRPVFYESKSLPKSVLLEYIKDKKSKKHNQFLPSELKPSPDLLAQAVLMRKEKLLTEPMFRTLIKLKRNY